MLSLFGATAPISTSGTSQSDDWPMFHHDASLTGYSNTEPLKFYPKVLWTTSYQRGGTFRPLSPAIVNNIVYVNDVGLHAYDSSTGRIIWEQSDHSSAPPVVEGGVVYTPAGAFDAQTGAVLWKANGYAFAAVANGIYYTDIVERKGEQINYMLVALNASNGARLWTNHKLIGLLAPAIANDQLFFGPYTVNATTGDEVWNWNVYTGIGVSPAYSNGNVFFGDINGNLYSVNSRNGDIVWNSTIAPHGSCSSPAVAYGLVYMGTAEGKILALNATDGKKVWSFNTTANYVGSSPAVAGGVVYAAAYDGNLYALDAYNGMELWNYNVGEQPETGCSPAIANGRIYIGSIFTHLTVLETDPFNVVVVSTLTVFTILICGVILVMYRGRRKTTLTRSSTFSSA